MINLKNNGMKKKLYIYIYIKTLTSINKMMRRRVASIFLEIICVVITL